jgi:hypothetical protein
MDSIYIRAPDYNSAKRQLAKKNYEFAGIEIPQDNLDIYKFYKFINPTKNEKIVEWDRKN